MNGFIGLGLMVGLVGFMVGPAFIARHFFGVGDDTTTRQSGEER